MLCLLTAHCNAWYASFLNNSMKDPIHIWGFDLANEKQTIEVEKTSSKKKIMIIMKDPHKKL